MSRRPLLIIAILAYVATGAGGILLDLDRPGDLVGDIIFSLWLTALFAVGAIIVWRHPRHKVGWLLVGSSLAFALSLTTKTYAYDAYFDGGDLPARAVAAWLSHWLSVPPAGLLLLAMILFPDGRLPSERWRWPLVGLSGVLMLAAAGLMFRPGPIDGLGDVQNAFGTGWGETLWDLSQISQPIVALAVAALLISLVIRSRRGSETERQQIRWVAYSLLAIPIALIVSELAQRIDKSPEDWLGFLVVMMGLLALPISLGIAILRYRLYDIDLVINKTIVYLVLSALLALVYFGGVALLQSLVGLDEQNDLAVAASTLAVAGLFQPARRRIQGFIDHYFYRRKYDAQRTIDEFSVKLRDEIDLDALNVELVDVVARTMQPIHVSVWVPRAEGKAG